ncbi:MAG TPA: FAD-dependent thymidylate synthase, partial [Thermodesulfovibrio thiophilus]|nr:FAD-dependent thymidylate synthase [Thermodesulfovibrio thiophilus]
PLGSHSKMILKINVRALFHLAHERLCTRAYWEIQDFVILLKKKIYELGGEWRYISQLMQPKCEYIGYCKEKHSCGRYPRREEFVKT